VAWVDSRDELLARSDVVSLHVPAKSDTRGLVDADFLGKLRPGAILLNTSRGEVVDEVALLEAVHSDKIAGAGLDVFDREPLPLDHPLRRAPRTVLTPHLGYVTEKTYEVFYGDAVEDVAAWMAGAPVRLLT
jgi:phosphoglycerate dehydrogenase-like enzyme